MQEQWLKIKTTWLGLSERDQRISVLCSVCLLLFFVYIMIWQPINNATYVLRKKLVAEQQTLAWMKATDKELRKVEASKRNTPSEGKATSLVLLMSVIQKQMNQAGLEQYLTQMKQVSNRSIEMHFQRAEFDKLLKSLIVLINEQNITIERMSVVNTDTLGIINADILLTQ